MKYLLIAFSAVFVLTACSGDKNITVLEEAAQDTTEAVSEANADSVAGEGIEENNGKAQESEGSEQASDDETAGDEEDTAGLDQKNVKLIIKNQTTAGQIIVEQVSTSRDGWVSIHKSEEGGGIQLPDSIGEARVDSGDSEDVIVDLWEAPDIDEKLWVLLHIDAGERGKYEFPGKDQAVRKNGETMARSFVIEDPNPDKEEAEDDE